MTTWILGATFVLALGYILLGLRPEHDETPVAPPEPFAPGPPWALDLEGTTIEASDAPQLLRKVVLHLIEAGQLTPEHLPANTGRWRSLIAEEPVHPSGREFQQPEQVGPYWVELDSSATNAMRSVRALCIALDVPFRVVDTCT